MKGFKNTWIVTEEGLKKTSFTYSNEFLTIGKNEAELEELPDNYVIVPGFIGRKRAKMTILFPDFPVSPARLYRFSDFLPSHRPPGSSPYSSRA